MRIFKEESELEVWKQDDSGRFALLRIYPICRWSGQLGPKMKEGDRQAPEGFYTITAGQMNPNSNYYLAINTGFPNIYDRANGRTGEFLMIHGDCASVGCYAMTDEQIAEIYALARESFFGGQRAFQLEAFPFRMTPLNMARHRNSPHMAFWKMLKQGYDHFGVTHNEPRVAVCEKRYVFDAETTGRFSPAERCPDYGVPDHIAVAVREKQRRDDILTAELISRGMPTVPITTGIDGGMNPTFLAAIKSHGGPGATMRTAAGTIPAHVNPPAEPAEITGSFTGLDSIQSRPAAGVQVASAESSGGIGSLLGNLFGSKSEGQTATERNTPPGQVFTQKAEPSVSEPAPAIAAIRPKFRPQPENARTASALVPRQPAALAKREASVEPQRPPKSTTTTLLNGAAPTVPPGASTTALGRGVKPQISSAFANLVRVVLCARSRSRKRARIAIAGGRRGAAPAEWGRSALLCAGRAVLISTHYE